MLLLGVVFSSDLQQFGRTTLMMAAIDTKIFKLPVNDHYMHDCGSAHSSNTNLRTCNWINVRGFPSIHDSIYD